MVPNLSFFFGNFLSKAGNIQRNTPLYLIQLLKVYARENRNQCVYGSSVKCLILPNGL